MKFSNISTFITAVMVLPFAVKAVYPTEAEVEAAKQYLAGNDGQPPSFFLAPAAAGASIASSLGKEVFKSIASKGGDMVLEEVLAALGYGSDSEAEVLQALAEIQASIDALSNEVQAIHQGIERLLHESDKQNYYNSYRKSAEASTAISTESLRVQGWIKNGLTPNESVLAASQTVVTGSIGQLADNTVDTTAGTIPMMMRAAEPSRVSDLVGYWFDIDAARDGYRANLAQGLVTLDLMTRWDSDGTIASDIDTLTPVAESSVHAMYSFGLDIPQPERLGYVNIVGSNELLVPKEAIAYPKLNAKNWVTLGNTRAEYEPRFQKMAEYFQPTDDNGPQSIEELLTTRGFPTRIDYADTYHLDYKVIEGCPYDGCVPTRTWATITSTEGYIEGNQYKTRTLTHVKDKRDRTKSEMQRETDNLAAAAAATTLASAGTIESNLAGRAADFDPNRIEDAAFGAPKLWETAKDAEAGTYKILGPLYGPLEVLGSGYYKYPVIGTDNSGLSGGTFTLEKLEDGIFVIRSPNQYTTHDYLRVSDGVLKAGAATKDEAARFQIRTSSDGRTWIRIVSWAPYVFWLGQDPNSKIRDAVIIKGDPYEDFYLGYDNDHYFTLVPL